MTHDSSPQNPNDIAVPDFIPVPMARHRHDGWGAERQRAFLMALSATGSVEAAAQIVRMSRESAYQLRAREGAESFAAAWDLAVGVGRARIFDYMMDRTLNGVTTIRIKRGGAIDIGHALDGHLVATQLKAPLPGRTPFQR
jgi:hypothetical protein